MRRPALWLAAVATPALAGCSSNLNSLPGAITGAIAATTSAHPAVGYAAGIAAKSATDAVMHYIARERQDGEQDDIVRVVGPLKAGESSPWTLHTVPLLGKAHGSVTVVREIANPLAPCKELVFTVAAGDKPDAPSRAYVTTACTDGAIWKWAAAEPVTDRWGALQ